MIYPKISRNWSSGFKEGAKNVKKFTTDERRTTKDDGQKQIAIRHLSDSSDLNIHTQHITAPQENIHFQSLCNLGLPKRKNKHY